jgi:hypothetical protein
MARAAAHNRACDAEAAKQQAPQTPSTSRRHRDQKLRVALEPQPRGTGSVVEFDPRDAVVPSLCFQHGALHRAHAPDRDRAG